MAKIETTFIRPKELYTPETGETKVVYDGYQNNPHELVVEENLEGEVSEIVNDTFVPNESGNVVFIDNNETEHELITEDGFAGALDTAMPTALAKAQVIETTWQELKDKRDNGQLIAGSLYRITDYNCTTTQENTRSAGHQFDIVLLALSANKLAEEGWAMMNESNVYDVTFSDGVTLKCYVYDQGDNFQFVDISTMLGIDSGYTPDEIIIDEINKTISFPDGVELNSTELVEEGIIYNYFLNSNLSAWKLWYCLDNDTDRFAWADDAEQMSIKFDSYTAIRYPQGDVDGFYAWQYEDSGETYVEYTKTPTPKVGEYTYDDTFIESAPVLGVSGFGRGVIYRLIDEYNNDVAYDFKNIQFVVKLDIETGYYDDAGTNTFVYSLNAWINASIMDASIVGNTLQNDVGIIDMVANNVIKTMPPIYTDTKGYYLPFNVVLTSNEDGEGYYGVNDVNFSNYSSHNIVISPCCAIHFNGSCNGNVIPTNVYVTFINCVNMTESNSYSGLYIDNKKVLTET